MLPAWVILPVYPWIILPVYPWVILPVHPWIILPVHPWVLPPRAPRVILPGAPMDATCFGLNPEPAAQPAQSSSGTTGSLPSLAPRRLTAASSLPPLAPSLERWKI